MATGDVRQLEHQIRRLVEAVGGDVRGLTTDQVAELLDGTGAFGTAVQGLLVRLAERAAQDAGRQAQVVDDLRRAATAAATLTDLVAAARGGLSGG